MKRLFTSRIVLGLVFLCTGLAASATDTVSGVSLVPEFHGVFRGRWEMETNDGAGRFQVRNARIVVEGRVAPIIAYKFQTDLCDRGKIRILDAFATVTPRAALKIKVGQYRMPFGMDSFRGPGGYFFNNRSYIGRRLNNVRAAGISAAYTLPCVPLTLDAGVFNPTSISDHDRWVKKYAFAAKIVYAPGAWKFSTGAESLLPEDVRINLYGASASWGNDRFYAEAEYMCRVYTSGTHPTTHGINIFADYGIPLRKPFFDTWSFQARYDAMGNLANGTGVVDGRLPTTDPGRQRVTLGTTLDYRYKKVRAAIRLNYELVFHDSDTVLDKGDDDKVSVELIIKF